MKNYLREREREEEEEEEEEEGRGKNEGFYGTLVTTRHWVGSINICMCVLLYFILLIGLGEMGWKLGMFHRFFYGEIGTDVDN